MRPIPSKVDENHFYENKSLNSSFLPTFIEIKSDEEEAEIFRKMAKSNGGRIKKYKKEKSLGILC